MYVNWLLQFVWIIFVQGPLIIIKVLQELIKKLLGLNLYDNFFGGGEITGAKSVLLNYAFFATISVVLLMTFFIIKLIMIFGSDKINIKYKLISLSKDAGKFFVIIVLFPLFFMAFTLVLGSISVAIFGVASGKGGFEFNLANHISNYYFNDVNAPNFSLTESNIVVLSTNVNFFVQIGASLTGCIIMIWFFASYIIKIIEIFILFIAFPIGESIAIGEGDIKRKKWINEILNKSLMLIATIMFYFLFITLLRAGSKLASSNPGSKEGIASVKPIINFLFLIIASWLIIALNWFFTRKIREHNGILQSLNSIKQTGLFIKSLQSNNAKQLRNIKVDARVNNSNSDTYTNDNIRALRYDLKAKIAIDKEGLKSLKKTKIFKE